MKTYNVVVSVIILLFSNFTFSQTTVNSFQKISATQGSFTGTLDDDDRFGVASPCIGDLDNDGVNDIVVGAMLDDDGGTDKGALWILFLNPNGTVKSHQKISDTQGGLTVSLPQGSLFGYSVDTIGDVNSDGVVDLAVGAQYDNDGGYWHGAIWILFMNSNGTVNGQQKISDTQGGFTANFSTSCTFGSSVAPIGDFNGDNIPDLAVGMRRDSDGGTRRGAVFIICLNANGTVNSYHKISDTQGNFTGILGNEDFFGCSVSSLGDMDGNGINDLCVGAFGDNDGGGNCGCVWNLFLEANGEVKNHQKISATQGGFTDTLDINDRFGEVLDCIGDYNNDGVTDLLVGAPYDDDGGVDRGAAWLIYLNANGTVNDLQKISSTQGGFNGTLDDEDLFGHATANLSDINGDGKDELISGAPWDDDGGTDRGAVWILFMESTTITPQTVSGIITYDNSFSTPLANVQLYLLDSVNQIIDSTISDINGEYAFLNVLPGTYTINSYSDHIWGGGNATDALAIMKHFVGTQFLYGLRLLAGDCDASNYINSMDGLYVAQRFVLLINSFPAGDWVFETPTILVDGTTTIIQDFMGLCVGDTDGSYIP